MLSERSASAFLRTAAIACLIIISVHTVGAETLNYRNYQFIHQNKDSLLVRHLLGKIEPSLIKIEDFFGYAPVSLVTIYLTRSEADYRKLTRNGIPEWSQAVAFGKEKIIVLKLISADDVLKGPEVLLHELVHIYFAERFPPGRVPNWLNEGLAQYLSGKRLTLQDKVFLAQSMSAKKLIGLDGLDTLLTFSRPRARLAYIEALSAVEYFIQDFGVNIRSLSSTKGTSTGFDRLSLRSLSSACPDSSGSKGSGSGFDKLSQRSLSSACPDLSGSKGTVNPGYQRLKELVKTLRTERSLNKAFLMVTGSDYIDFEVGWYAWLDEKFHWLLILNIDNLLWIGMGVLALLAIVFVRWRNRRKIKQWEAEDESYIDTERE
ncbi:MAG TPA: hypothetical protein ENK44_06900 [Caldithrix abyssi]|uniref:Peptidase MA-like domain-containing protein n=1 Tax=Caldithrix abyssi TaxID=187145 RepID=A0A7V4U0K3_CALAY|nr:hypothetical protein [Caldithrix abyssi]